MECISLGKLVDLKQGMAINKKSNHLVSEKETSLPLLRIADMATKSKTIFMDEKTPTRFIASKDDLIYTRTGQVGLVFRNQYGVVHNNCFRVMPKSDVKLDISYLYWVLKLKSISKYANLIASGSAQPDLPHGSFKKIKIPMFDIVIQKKISRILDEYESLIHNNNKRIKIIEQMAEELYKEWFVRFRYDIKTKSYKNSPLGKIPESFDIIKVRDAMDYYIGGGWGNDSFSEEFPVRGFVIRGADFPKVKKGDISSTPLRFHKQSNYNARKLEANDIVFEISGGTQEQPVGRSVLITEELLGQFDNSAICASFCKLIRVNEQIVSPIYLYYWLQYMYETRMIDQFQLQSTGIINFKFEYFLRKGLILLPPKDLMERFEKQVVLMKKQIDELAIANSNLIKQRDLLLPRLMSGKLEVK